LIEQLDDGPITIRLTMIATRDPSQPAVTPRIYHHLPNDRSATTMRSVESRSAISATEVGFDDLQPGTNSAAIRNCAAAESTRNPSGPSFCPAQTTMAYTCAVTADAEAGHKGVYRSRSTT
jgi:hypothetical protein